MTYTSIEECAKKSVMERLKRAEQAETADEIYALRLKAFAIIAFVAEKMGAYDPNLMLWWWGEIFDKFLKLEEEKP